MNATDADFGPLFQRHRQTSRLAAEAIQPIASGLRGRVYESIFAASDGLTDEQIQDATGIGSSTQRPRRIELMNAGLIRDSGRTRKLRSGRSAIIWVATELESLTCPLSADHLGT